MGLNALKKLVICVSQSTEAVRTPWMMTKRLRAKPEASMKGKLREFQFWQVLINNVLLFSVLGSLPSVQPVCVNNNYN